MSSYLGVLSTNGFEIIGGRVDPDQVMQDTWGHLNAPPGVRYYGTMVFAESTYGELFILNIDFGNDAGDGPWFYEALQEWLADQETEPGQLYRFTGWYSRDEDNAHEFVGQTTRLPGLPEQARQPVDAQEE